MCAGRLAYLVLGVELGTFGVLGEHSAELYSHPITDYFLRWGGGAGSPLPRVCTNVTCSFSLL